MKLYETLLADFIIHITPVFTICYITTHFMCIPLFSFFIYPVIFPDFTVVPFNFYTSLTDSRLCPANFLSSSFSLRRCFIVNTLRTFQSNKPQLLGHSLILLHFFSTPAGRRTSTIRRREGQKKRNIHKTAQIQIAAVRGWRHQT